MEEKMLCQLAWIKWIVLAIAIVIVAPVTAYLSYAWYEMTRPTVMSAQACEPTATFPDKAKQLLISGKEQELITLAAAREKIYPKDPYVHLYLGHAYFQLKDYRKAVLALTTTEALAPDRKEQYIQPFLAAAKRNLEPSIQGQEGATPVNYAEAYEKQMQQVFAQLAVSDAQQKRMGQLLADQDQHVKRYGAVLEKWEQQAGLRK